MKIDTLPLLNRVIELATQLGVERQEGEAIGAQLNKVRDALAISRLRVEQVRASAIKSDDFLSHMRTFMQREDKAAANREAIAYLRKYFDEECPF